MEPTQPDPHRPSSIPTFERVQATFRGNPATTTFRCLINNARPIACVTLEANQVQHASQILCSDLPRSLRDVWDVVNCLVCVQHQGDRIYTYKHQVMDRWQDDFPQLDFSSSPMPRSRYSLCSTPRSARRHTQMRDTRQERPSTSRAGAGNPSHGRYNTEPATPSPESRSIDHDQAADEDVDMDDDPFIATPDSTRPTTPADGEEQALRNGHEEDQPHNLDSALTPARPPPPSTQQRSFVPGTSSTWPLWRVRQEVRHLILEPLPSPRAHGILYAVHSPQHNKVKIGYTMRRKFEDRLRELQKQHDGTLGHHWYLSKIPYVQLLRLEELVHADLARYQCDYKVQFGHGNGFRVHREWFDIDLATAQQTMKFWWAAMRHLRIEPGRELHKRWEDRLSTQGAMFEVKRHNVTGAFDNYRDHEQTLRLWTELLDIPGYGSKTWKACWWLLMITITTRLCGTSSELLWLDTTSKHMMLLLAIWTAWACI